MFLGFGAAVPHLHPRAAKYEGYHVFRVETGDKLTEVSKKLAGLDYEQWNHDSARHIDFSMSREEAKKFKELGIDFKEMHSDLGEDIAQEGNWGPWKGKKSQSLILPLFN